MDDGVELEPDASVLGFRGFTCHAQHRRAGAVCFSSDLPGVAISVTRDSQPVMVMYGVEKPAKVRV
jgi:hypothetical protein